MVRRLLLAVAILIVAALALPPLWYAAFPDPAPELPPAGRRVEVAPGVGLNVVEQGHGRPVVLVHGHPGSAYDWLRLMDALAARGQRAVAYDRAGYGHSDARPGGDHGVPASAHDLLALLAAEGIDDALLVGWSYGGGVSIVAAREDASRIAGLVLVGSVGPGIEARGGPPRAVVDLVMGPALAWLGRVPPLRRRVGARFLSLAFAPEPVPPGAVARADANLARPRTVRTLRSEGWDLDGRVDLDPRPIRRPILVVHGDGDRLVPLSVAEGLARRARDAERWVVPGGGHALPVTRADALADRIAAFAGGAARR